MIQTLGFGRYYERRSLDPQQRPPRPEGADARDLSRFIVALPDQTHELTLAIDGLQCAACVWLVESVLGRDQAVVSARINLTTRRLRLAWRGQATEADRLVARIESLGYRLVPFDAAALAASADETGRGLMRAMAVAGFAAANVMLISIGIWAGEAAGWLDSMGPATRDLLHWMSALIALPAILYAGVPFFRSAMSAIRRRRTNMDVSISIGILLVSGMSLSETLTHGPHTYFDSAVTLLFFLLIGRVLDHRARGQARSVAEQLLMLRSVQASVIQPDGTIRPRPQEAILAGDRLLVALGERIGADGTVETGDSSVDTSAVTGESLPARVRPGSMVFAGTLNMGEPLTIRATVAGGSTLLAECVRLIEAAEVRRARYVVLADRAARAYAPAVHAAALASFLWWFLVAGAGVGPSLLIASAVLIITCPCALALAVPAVQVIATSRLLRLGILLKTPTALERLAEVDTVIFDKTGTLTEPALILRREGVDPDALREAASLAQSSRHPLARSLVAASDPVAARADVIEYPGHGMAAEGARIGSGAFCGAEVPPGDVTPELWLTRPGHEPVRFAFEERTRPDAAATIKRLKALRLRLRLVSGDKPGAVGRIAAAVGIDDWLAARGPVDKVAAIETSGRRVLMVGDGLNDSAALAAAHVSVSPATAADISQTLADAVFQGASLAPVAILVEAARRARRIMQQNLALAIGYNVLMVPLAMAGYVTPWLAAAAMSSSSILVIANSFRAGRVS